MNAVDIREKTATDERKALVAELEVSHGKLMEIHVPETEWDDEQYFYAKRPSRAEWKRFRTMLADQGTKADALETIARACIVHPERAELARLLDERPALAEVLGNEIAEFAGATGSATGKKA